MKLVNPVLRRAALTLAVGAGLAGSFYAGAAYAADAAFDDANAHLEKAVLLLKSAQNPNARNPKAPFGGHRLLAVKAIQLAEKEIAKAKAFADKPAPPPKDKGKGKDRGGKHHHGDHGHHH